MADVTDIKDDPNEEGGWERRSILDEPRLTEVVKMYRELGMEVKVVDLDPGLLETCETCLIGAIERYKVVYTKGIASAGADDIFD